MDLSSLKLKRSCTGQSHHHPSTTAIAATSAGHIELARLRAMLVWLSIASCVACGGVILENSSLELKPRVDADSVRRRQCFAIPPGPRTQELQTPKASEHSFSWMATARLDCPGSRR